MSFIVNILLSFLSDIFAIYADFSEDCSTDFASLLIMVASRLNLVGGFLIPTDLSVFQ